MFDLDTFFRQLRATLSFFWGLFLSLGATGIVVSTILVGFLIYKHYIRK